MVIAIDETPVGVFVEIEGGEDAIHADGARRSASTPADYITDSYRFLFLQHRDANGLAGHDMVFAGSPRMTRRRAAALDGSDLSDWPALVLTAGLATRLQPLSSCAPRPRCRWPAKRSSPASCAGCTPPASRRVVLNLHHRADTITRIVGDGSPLGLAVRYSWETEILGSAGGPARAIPLLESDRFLIVNGDTLADVDLRALATQHVDTNALVTMAVVDGRSALQRRHRR